MASFSDDTSQLARSGIRPAFAPGVGRMIRGVKTHGSTSTPGSSTVTQLAIVNRSLRLLMAMAFTLDVSQMCPYRHLF